MFGKVKNGMVNLGKRINKKRKQLSLFLAMGIVALTAPSAQAADIVTIDDTTGAMSFNISSLITDLKGIFAGVVNNALDLFILGLGVWMVVKLVKKLTNKAA